MVKIGRGYWQSGYGRGFKKKPIVRLINGKAYVKDAQALPFQTDMDGYAMVNSFIFDDREYFACVGLISEHVKYNKFIKK